LETETIELGGELASELKAAAKARGVTLREFVIHVLLQYVEETSDSEEGSDEDLDDEDEEVEGEGSPTDEED